MFHFVKKSKTFCLKPLDRMVRGIYNNPINLLILFPFLKVY